MHEAGRKVVALRPKKREESKQQREIEKGKILLRGCH